MSPNDKKDEWAGPGGQPRNLPPGGEGRIYGGRGQGGPCALCGASIEPSQIEYEVEWSSEAGLRRSQFHLACYEKLRARRED